MGCWLIFAQLCHRTGVAVRLDASFSISAQSSRSCRHGGQERQTCSSRGGEVELHSCWPRQPAVCCVCPIGDLFHCCPGCRPSPARCGSGWEVSGQLLTQIPDDLELDHADPGLALGSSRRRARWADPGKQAAASIQQTWQTKAPLWFPSMCHWLLSSPRNQNQTPKTLNRGVLWESTPKPEQSIATTTASRTTSKQHWRMQDDRQNWQKCKGLLRAFFHLLGTNCKGLGFRV